MRSKRGSRHTVSEDLWSALKPVAQLEAIRQVAHHFARNGYSSLAPNVVGIAFGARKKRVATRRAKARVTQLIRKDLCLVVVVDRKLSMARLSRKHSLRRIPDRVRMTVRLGEDEAPIEVTVPTDVISRPRRPKAQAITGLLMSNFDEGLSLKGSVAALVRDNPDLGLRYYLTCHHVACLSLLDSDLQARLPVEAFALPSNTLMGSVDREAFFGAQVGPCVDAALVRIDDDVLGADISTRAPVHGFVTNFPQLVQESQGGMWLYSLHNPDGTPATFQRSYFNLDIGYEAGAVATIVEVLEYRLDDTHTKSGDSGGALVSNSGILIGMHIAGVGSIGYGIPAYMLLDAPSFNPPVVLA